MRNGSPGFAAEGVGVAVIPRFGIGVISPTTKGAGVGVPLTATTEGEAAGFAAPPLPVPGLAAGLLEPPSAVVALPDDVDVAENAIAMPSRRSARAGSPNRTLRGRAEKRFQARRGAD